MWKREEIFMPVVSTKWLLGLCARQKDRLVWTGECLSVGDKGDERQEGSYSYWVEAEPGQRIPVLCGVHLGGL